MDPTLLLLLIIVVCSAAWSAYRTRRERERQLKALEISQVDAMSGPEFEYYVSRLLGDQGYQVEIVGHSGDLGVDLLAQRKGKFIGVQRKFQANRVSRRAVIDLVARNSPPRRYVNGFQTSQFLELSTSCPLRPYSQPASPTLLQEAPSLSKEEKLLYL